ncbi:MAG: proline--tRNA ligase [Spirochaetales bacterium]|nr:proline--tRNA ligase [Spirochaetales bacterium]
MRMSKVFSRTLRQAPAGADSKGYEYLLRAGFIKQLGAGIFTSLPFGFRSLKKIEDIIREEMNALGGQEMSMPVVNPADIWKETGRFYTIDKELSRFKDRVGRDMVLAMTHEEAVTAIAAQEIDSYKQMPSMVYHIQTKWRDDPRPRAGLIRVREFTMKDSYTFDQDHEGLEKQYAAHYSSYFKIFGRCGLPVTAVGSDSGMMGGKVAHEYMYLSPIGEDSIVICDHCGYTANRQVAKFAKDYYPEDELKAMEEVETPGTATIEDLAAFLDIPKRKTAKAVFMMGTYTNEDNEEYEKLVVGIVRGDLDAEEAKLQNTAEANSLRTAQEEEIRACGMEPGYGSPIGSRNCVVIVDDSAAKSANLAAGANKPGYHYINTNFERDYGGIAADIASAYEGAACPECGKPMHLSRGIEVGNIFQLGTRYSESLNCYFQDINGKRKPVVMGSYGIGVGRLLACLTEEYHDDKGLMLPISVAPYQVHLVSLIKKGEEPEELYKALTDAGIEVLYDDRKDSPGVKFTDAELIGLPIQITMGKRTLEKGAVEVKLRKEEEKELVPLGEIVPYIQKSIAKLEQEIKDSITEETL